MSELNPEEIADRFSAWEEFKESALYKEIEDDHPLRCLTVFMAGWNANKNRRAPEAGLNEAIPIKSVWDMTANTKLTKPIPGFKYEPATLKRINEAIAEFQAWQNGDENPQAQAEPVAEPEICPLCRGKGGHQYSSCGDGCCVVSERCENCKGSGKTGLIGYVYADDLRQLQINGIAQIYQEPQQFTLIQKQDEIPLYTHPIPAAPAVPDNIDRKDLLELRPFYTRTGAIALIKKHWPDMFLKDDIVETVKTLIGLVEGPTGNEVRYGSQRFKDTLAWARFYVAGKKLLAASPEQQGGAG